LECLKKTASFSIFETEIENPVFTTDDGVTLLGNIQLQANEHDIISIEICFGAMKITATAHNKTQDIKSDDIRFVYDFEKEFASDNSENSDEDE